MRCQDLEESMEMTPDDVVFIGLAAFAPAANV